MASILETFFILFETDAKRVQGEILDADKAGEHLADTLDKVGDVDPTGVRKVADAVEDAGDEARRLGGGLRDTKRPVRELTDELRKADQVAGGLGSKFVGWARALAAPLATLVSVSAVLGSVRSRMEYVTELTAKASSMNFDLEAYDAWGRAIRDVGGDAQEAEQNFKAFGEKVSEAFGDAESDAAKALAQIGVSSRDAAGALKTTDQALLDLAEASQKVTRQQAIDSLRRLGIVDANTVKMILQGRDALEKQLEAQRKNGVVTKETAERVLEFRRAWQGALDVVRGMVDALLGGLAPVMTRVTTGLQTMSRWVRENSGFVKAFGVALVAAGAIALAVTYGALIPAAVAAVAAWALAVAPFVLLTAAIVAVAAAVALAWDDVQAFLKGQPSLLGDLVNRYEWVRKAVEAIGAGWQYLAREVPRALQAIGSTASEVFGAIWRVVGPVLSLIVDGFKLVGDVQGTVLRVFWAMVQQVFGAVWPYVQPIYAALAGGIEAVGGVFASVAQSIWGAWAALFNWFAERIGALVARVRDFMGWVEKGRQALERLTPGGGAPPATAQAVQRGRGQVAAAQAAPLAAQTPGSLGARSTTSRQTTVQVDKVEVHTQATDAEGMAKAAGGALSSQLRRTTANFDDGVDR